MAGSYERGTHGSAFTVFDSTHGYAALFSELHRIASHPPPALPLSLSFAPSCSLSLSARSLSLHALSTAPPLPTPDEALKQDQLSRESTSQPRTTREKSRMAMSSGRCRAALMRNRHPVGPYSRTMPRALWWSQGWASSFVQGTPVTCCTFDAAIFHLTRVDNLTPSIRPDHLPGFFAQDTVFYGTTWVPRL